MPSLPTAEKRMCKCASFTSIGLRKCIAQHCGRVGLTACVVGRLVNSGIAFQWKRGVHQEYFLTVKEYDSLSADVSCPLLCRYVPSCNTEQRFMRLTRKWCVLHQVQCTQGRLSGSYNSLIFLFELVTSISVWSIKQSRWLFAWGLSGAFLFLCTGETEEWNGEEWWWWEERTGSNNVIWPIVFKS